MLNALSALAGIFYCFKEELNRTRAGARLYIAGTSLFAAVFLALQAFSWDLPALGLAQTAAGNFTLMWKTWTLDPAALFFASALLMHPMRNSREPRSSLLLFLLLPVFILSFDPLLGSALLIANETLRKKMDASCFLLAAAAMCAQVAGEVFQVSLGAEQASVLAAVFSLVYFGKRTLFERQEYALERVFGIYASVMIFCEALKGGAIFFPAAYVFSGVLLAAGVVGLKKSNYIQCVMLLFAFFTVYFSAFPQTHRALPLYAGAASALMAVSLERFGAARRITGEVPLRGDYLIVHAGAFGAIYIIAGMGRELHFSLFWLMLAAAMAARERLRNLFYQLSLQPGAWTKTLSFLSLLAACYMGLAK